MNTSEIAKHFNISKQAVYLWFRTQVPVNRVLELEKLTGVPRYELRPDIYPPKEYKQAS